MTEFPNGTCFCSGSCYAVFTSVPSPHPSQFPHQNSLQFPNICLTPATVVQNLNVSMGRPPLQFPPTQSTPTKSLPRQQNTPSSTPGSTYNRDPLLGQTVAFRGEDEDWMSAKTYGDLYAMYLFDRVARR
jgi:hypothetical protein